MNGIDVEENSEVSVVINLLVYRKIEEKDISDFWEFLNTLDDETMYMMYEPGERKRSTNCQELEDDIKINVFKRSVYR